MKQKHFIFYAMIGICIALTSCPNNIDDYAYAVWTDVGAYSDFQSGFGRTLDDGMYLRLEFNSSEWSQISSTLTNEGKHSWTKS